MNLAGWLCVRGERACFSEFPPGTRQGRQTRACVCAFPYARALTALGVVFQSRRGRSSRVSAWGKCKLSAGGFDPPR